MVTLVRSNTLSLIPSWSPIKAELGGLLGVIVEVTHRVPSPGSGFDATQCGGRAGAVTPSQFSTHGPDGLGLGLGGIDGVGTGVPVAVAVAVGVLAGVADGTGAPLPRS